MGTFRPDGVEQLTVEEGGQLAEELRSLGWAYIPGQGGIHRAEKLGTHRQEQASLTREGLLRAVRGR